MSKVSPGFRNIAFVGHSSAGKTTLVDAMAHKLGVSDRKGSVPDKTSLCDTEPEEQEKGHTLQLSVVHAERGECAWNLIDTPGYPDFEAETREGMYAADLVVGVLSLATGLTYNFRRKMQAAAQMGRPRAIVVTHPDAETKSFEELVDELREAIGEVCVPVLLPDMDGKQFRGCHRVILDENSAWRPRLMDRVMDACDDEELLNRYLEEQKLSDDEIRRFGPIAIAKSCLIPIMICDPASGLGVDDVIGFLDRAGPTPQCHPSFTAGGEPIAPDAQGPLLGVVFAVRSDPHLGRVTYVRILSGTLGAHDAIQECSGEHKPEKVGGLFAIQGGKQRSAIEEVPAGGIAALAKVEHLGIGQSFCAAGQAAPAADFAKLPTPKVSLAAVPKTSNDEQKIGPALHKLEAEDPSLRVVHDPLTHELVLTGTSELHLSLVEARLARRYGVHIETHLPRIAYRETIRKPAEGHHRHKKQSGGRGQFGECHLRVRPGEDGSGVVFHDKVVGGAIPRNLIPAIEKGIRELASKGVLTHSQVVDVEVEVYDGKFHAVDSDEASFKMAGARAFKEAFLAASPTLLEPVMELEIHVPAHHAGTVFSDLTSHRRGHVVDQSSEEDGAVTIIQAHVPLATVLTYNRELKSQTAGEGAWSMKPHHYAPVPEAEAKKIAAASVVGEAD